MNKLGRVLALAIMLPLLCGFGGVQQSYQVGGVHFNATPTQLGTIYGTASALTGVSAGTTWYALVWMKGTGTDSSTTGGQNSFVNSYVFTNFGGNCEQLAGLCLSFDAALGNYGTLHINMGDTTASSAAHICGTTSGATLPPFGKSFPVLLAGNTSLSGTTEVVSAYVNDVNVLSGTCTYSTGGPFNIGFNNSSGFYLGDSPGTLPLLGADMFQFVLNTHDNIICKDANPITVNSISYACPSVGFIPDDVRHLFYTANLQPKTIPALCNYTGTRGDVCNQGDSTSFFTNIGTSTGLALTQGVAYDAPYGPRGTTKGQAAINWSYGTSAGSGVATLTTNAGKNVSNAGDLILYTVFLADSTNTPGNHSMTCPAGTSAVTSSGFTNPLYAGANPPNGPTDVILCYEIATGAGAGARTFTWTANVTRVAHWMVTDIVNYDPSGPFDKVASQVNSLATTTANQATPALSSLTNSNDLFLTLHLLYGAGTAAPTLPSGMNLYNDVWASTTTGNPATVLMWKYLTTNAAAAQTIVTSGAGGNAIGQGVAIAIKGAP